VWLGNFKGSKYGRNHLNYDPESVFIKEKFWNFGVNEIA
jgi:hypothetical protein